MRPSPPIRPHDRAGSGLISGSAAREAEPEINPDPASHRSHHDAHPLRRTWPCNPVYARVRRDVNSNCTKCDR
jgi:hypothetical protein